MVRLANICGLSQSFVAAILSTAGLTMNSVNLAGDLFLNTLLGVLIEAPGYLLAMLTMDCWGRKPLLVVCQLVAGTACIAAGFVPPARPGHTWPDTLRVSLSCIGKLGSSAAFSLVYLYRFCVVFACYSSLLYC